MLKFLLPLRGKAFAAACGKGRVLFFPFVVFNQICISTLLKHKLSIKERGKIEKVKNNITFEFMF